MVLRFFFSFIFDSSLPFPYSSNKYKVKTGNSFDGYYYGARAYLQTAKPIPYTIIVTEVKAKKKKMK